MKAASFIYVFSEVTIGDAVISSTGWEPGLHQNEKISEDDEL